MNDIKNYTGLTDRAAEKDEFKITNYTSGLVDYIKNCYTPMTLSIQGTWGTGKTSFMNLMIKELDQNQCIQFNTWQYSQFDMGDTLPISLMGKIIKSLSIGDEGTEEEKFEEEKTRFSIKKLQIGVAKGIRLAGYGLADKFVGDAFAEEVFKSKSNAENDLNSQKIDEFATEDVTDVIENLKNQFEKMVDLKIKSLKKINPSIDRLIFFIDDLDRLSPTKAVELLEVMKLFLDCKNCVFVLAIDHEVVYRGVAQKYNLDYEKEKEKEKGKSFFDKNIQVPFSIPVDEYELNGYVKSCLDQINIPYSKESLKIYVRLVENSMGRNPRSMKRLFNQFLLLTKIKSGMIGNNYDLQLLLFAVLCMQHSFDEVYLYLLRNAEEITADVIETLGCGDFEKINSEIQEFECDEDLALKLKIFMEAFFDAMDTKQKNGNIDSEELDNLKTIFNVSCITATVSEKPTRKKAEYQYRGKRYISGSRSGNNLGNMCRDIISDVAAELKWNKDDMELFRAECRSMGVTNWLHEIIFYEDDILNLECNPDLYEKVNRKEIRAEYGYEKTVTYEDFVDHFWCYIPSIKSEDCKSINMERLHNDEKAIILSDNTRCFVGRYWGYVEIEKMKTMLKTKFDYELNAVDLSFE